MRKVLLPLVVFMIAAGDGGASGDPNVIIDPNMIVWYRFDETAPNNIAHDSSGYEHDGFVDTETGDPNWDPNDGRYGGSLVFNNDTAVILPAALLSDINEGIAISVWLKDAYRQDATNCVFDAGLGPGAEHRVQIAVVTQPEQLVLWRAGNDTNDVLTWDLWGTDPSTLEEWHWWIFVKDERTGEMHIYVDPIMFRRWWWGDCSVASKTGIDKTLINVSNTGSKIGAKTYHDNDFVGKMDDFRIYDRALSQYEICPPCCGDLACAWAPDPRSGEQDVQRGVVLTWRPGDFTVEHHVFFGTNWEDVNSMTDPCAIKSIGDESYEPGPLALDTTYWWRVDEVNEPDVWKCQIWEFTTANYIIIDDFEPYDHGTHRIWYTWRDGVENWSGSYVDLGSEPFSPVHGGDQSMLFSYDNTVRRDGSHYWSEVELLFDSPQDWTDGGVKALTLYFYGHPDNDVSDTEELYVAVGGSYDEVRYTDDAGGDMNDLKLAGWTEWNIEISDFGGVDACSVTSFFIGFGDRDNATVPGGDGTVYFDDIRLYRPRCVPAKVKPLADFTNDCVVDYKDLKVIADNWLNGPIEPNAPIGWWKLDEGQGNVAHDSSVYGNHGTIVGDYSWVAGCDGWNRAVEFIEGRVVVADSPQLRPATQVSACAWVKYSVTGEHNARIVVKGADNRETYCLEVDDDDTMAFVFRDVNGVFHGVDGTAELSHNEWVHIAGTYDGYAINCYVNGAFDSSATITPVLLSQDVNDLAIANRSDANDRQFEGAVDDVRVYDYGLTQDEIMWVAGDCGGVGPCRLIPNLYCGLEPEIINFEDYGVLAGMWLEQILWP